MYLEILRIKNLTNSKIYDIIIIESEEKKEMERTDYLVYGIYVDTPWEETLLCVVDNVDKAKYAVKAYTDSGDWKEVRYDCWKVQ